MSTSFSNKSSNKRQKNSRNAAPQESTPPAPANDEDDQEKDFFSQEIDKDGVHAFCCQNCTCGNDNPAEFARLCQIRNNCGNSIGEIGVGNTLLYHKACCHKGQIPKKINEWIHANYVSAMYSTIEKSTDIFATGGKPPDKAKPISHLLSKYYQSCREVKTFENQDSEVASDSTVYSCPVYLEYAKEFYEQKRSKKGGLKVLDLFCGISTGTIVLKKLQIPLHTVVNVDHDPVALYVSKFNHQDDGIQHIYIESFEEIYGDRYEPNQESVENIIIAYGPFDLVLAGAPCQNYSTINSFKDSASENAQYLRKVGRLVWKINEVQRLNHGRKYGVLFLSENVVFGSQLVEDVSKEYSKNKEDGRALTPIKLDASDFSPCKRNRLYWTNITIKNPESIRIQASLVSADDHLDNNQYMMIARVLEKDEERSTVQKKTVKANAFMASKVRIDDSRMIKVLKSGEDYLLYTYSVKERERMMGFPEDYVAKATSDLFENLEQNAFLKPETGLPGNSYKTFLDKKFWHFRKKCHFRFLEKYEVPFFQLAISTPKENKNLSYYNREEYAKHLIGNGWSIPVVEHLLQGLRDLFSEDQLQSYEGFDYNYPWGPYNNEDHRMENNSE